MKFSDYFTTVEEETMPTRPADALALLQRQNTPALEPVEPPQDGDDGDDDQCLKQTALNPELPVQTRGQDYLLKRSSRC